MTNSSKRNLEDTITHRSHDQKKFSVTPKVILLMSFGYNHAKFIEPSIYGICAQISKQQVTEQVEFGWFI